MVRSPGQEAVCFDADAPVGSDILLFFDAVSGLSISGTIAHREELDRTVIDVIKIMTPGGVSMTIKHDSLIVDGYRNARVPSKELFSQLYDYDGSLVVGDAEIKALKRGFGLRAIR